MDYVYGYLFLQFDDGREFRQINPSQTLMNLQDASLRVMMNKSEILC